MIKPFTDKLGKEVAVLISPSAAKIILKEVENDPSIYQSAKFNEVIGSPESFNASPSVTLMERVNGFNYDVNVYGVAHGIFGDLAIEEIKRLVREF